LDTNSTTTASQGEIRVRGNSSAMHPKKPYRLELQDDTGHELKLPLLGLPKDSDWILFAAYLDKTLIRDVLAYKLWLEMGHWAPRTRYVELLVRTNNSSLNGLHESRPHPDPLPRQREARQRTDSLSTLNAQLSTLTSNDYQGVYVLMETVKRGKQRVNIAKLDPEDALEPEVTGGYIFKRDRVNSPNDRTFRNRKKLEFIFVQPNGRDITPAQEQYLTNYIINEFESVLFSDQFGGSDRGYRRFIDVDSFVDYHWMQELGKNPDGYWFSEFYHKERGGRLKIGPIWDFDMCFGNTWYNDGHLPQDWRWRRATIEHYLWYKRLFKAPDFLQRYIDRWSELRTNVLSTSTCWHWWTVLPSSCRRRKRGLPTVAHVGEESRSGEVRR
jgi:hypothetical protein